MIREAFPSLAKSIDKIKQNPQLWYTLMVAVLIVLAFVFVANRFVTIAQDAQDRLVNVRIGSLQDAFVEFASDYFEDGTDFEALQDKIKLIAIQNQTIKDFHVVSFENGQNKIVASVYRNEVGQVDQENSYLYGIAKDDPLNSYTAEIIKNNERFYTTVRTITDQYRNPVGAVLTTQSLSQADIAISNTIQNSILIFIVIVVLIMFLFFRHSKIIDYSTLYRRIKEVDQLKDDFISMASHELRTPLTVIRGYAENLRDTKSGKMTKEQKLSIERIDISARQLDNLVNDMLDVSKIDQGRMKFEPEVVDPQDLINEEIIGFEKVAKDKGLELKIVNSINQAIKIKADLDKFRQVVVNLIGNAIKYTKEGEVKIETSLEKNNFVIRVSDSGIGMTAEEQKNLFQKFYRVKNDQTQEIRGTGLGLWITKQIVELMGGQISVESIKGVGTHFIVSFPVV